MLTKKIAEFFKDGRLRQANPSHKSSHYDGYFPIKYFAGTPTAQVEIILMAMALDSDGEKEIGH